MESPMPESPQKITHDQARLFGSAFGMAFRTFLDVAPASQRKISTCQDSSEKQKAQETRAQRAPRHCSSSDRAPSPTQGRLITLRASPTGRRPES